MHSPFTIGDGQLARPDVPEPTGSSRENRHRSALGINPTFSRVWILATSGPFAPLWYTAIKPPASPSPRS